MICAGDPGDASAGALHCAARGGIWRLREPAAVARRTRTGRPSFSSPACCSSASSPPAPGCSRRPEDGSLRLPAGEVARFVLRGRTDRDRLGTHEPRHRCGFLTPVLVHMARTRGRGEAPVLYGCLLAHNAGSLLLPGSNLTNIIVAGHLHLAGAVFASHMAPAWALALVVTALVVAVAHRKDLAQPWPPRLAASATAALRPRQRRIPRASTRDHDVASARAVVVAATAGRRRTAERRDPVAGDRCRSIGSRDLETPARARDGHRRRLTRRCSPACSGSRSPSAPSGDLGPARQGCSLISGRSPPPESLRWRASRSTTCRRHRCSPPGCHPTRTRFWSGSISGRTSS